MKSAVSKNNKDGSIQRPPIGFATIKTTQAIVTEEQTQREQQDVIEFQNLKRTHMKLLKAVTYLTIKRHMNFMGASYIMKQQVTSYLLDKIQLFPRTCLLTVPYPYQT